MRTKQEYPIVSTLNVNDRHVIWITKVGQGKHNIILILLNFNARTMYVVKRELFSFGSCAFHDTFYPA